MRKPRTVLLVMVCVKYNYEDCAKEVLNLSRRLQGLPFRPAMHSKRQIAYVVQTDLVSHELMDRLGDTVHAGCIERVWIFTPGQDVVSDLSPDPLADYIKAAWVNVREWNQAKNMRRPKPREIFEKRGIKDGDRRAAVKMGIKPRRAG